MGHYRKVIIIRTKSCYIFTSERKTTLLSQFLVLKHPLQREFTVMRLFSILGVSNMFTLYRYDEATVIISFS